MFNPSLMIALGTVFGAVFVLVSAPWLGVLSKDGAWVGLGGWAQAIGSVIAVLAAAYVPWRIAKERAAAAEQERRFKARSLAIALYPELTELKEKLRAATTALDLIGSDLPLSVFDPRTKLAVEIPPVITGCIFEFYLLREVGDEIQQVLAFVRQFNRMVAQWDNTKVPKKASVQEARQFMYETLEPHLRQARERCNGAIKGLAPIHDQPA